MRVYVWTLGRDSGDVVIAATGRSSESARQKALGDLQTEYGYLGISEDDFPQIADTSYTLEEFALVVDNTRF